MFRKVAVLATAMNGIEAIKVEAPYICDVYAHLVLPGYKVTDDEWKLTYNIKCCGLWAAAEPEAYC